ncbi:MAG: putative Vacuolar protein sorting-associated protein 4, partial [Streblomastix strix]
PGTGKSVLAKAVATEVDAQFFSISAADITSKWIGVGEKNVKELFVQAREKDNSIIFIDEIDSIAGTRGSEGKSESSKNILTQLLVQLEGVGNDNSKVLFLAATNTPWSLDSAILRRLQKRVYIPLPDPVARETLFRLKLGDTPHNLTQIDFKILAQKADSYSGSDISNVVQDALMQPVRVLQKTMKFKKVQVEEIIPEEKDQKDAKKEE